MHTHGAPVCSSYVNAHASKHILKTHTHTHTRCAGVCIYVIDRDRASQGKRIPNRDLCARDRLIRAQCQNALCDVIARFYALNQKSRPVVGGHID